MFPISDYSRKGMADWIELNALVLGTFISKSMIINEMTNNSVDNSELFVTDVFYELSNRLELYGEPAPFIIKDQHIEPNLKWENKPDLALCLFFSHHGASNESGRNGGTKLFERLTGEAVISYLGGEGMCIGFPEQSLLDSVKEVVNRTNEKQGPIDELNSTDKDRGVDVVAWKTFGDSRSGQIVILVQCAAGKHWDEKSQIPDAWERVISWSTMRYIKSMSIVDIITDPNKWYRMCQKYGIMFDRTRLYRLTQQSPLSSELHQEITNWCRNKFLTLVDNY